MNWLADTNIFLEILLGRPNKNKCKKFLKQNIGHIYISDFSLHSIGVLLFSRNKEELFQRFLNDIFPKATLLTLPEDAYRNLSKYKRRFQLDFDDAYQTAIAVQYDLRVKTMDKDFKKVKGFVSVDFID